jgi:hypothetical protein
MTTAPVTVTVPGAGHAFTSRVPGADHVDVHLTVTLLGDENASPR